MSLQRSCDRGPEPQLALPCNGLRCSSRRSCAHFQASAFVGPFAVRMDRCPHDNGEPVMFIEVPAHEPLAEPTAWGDL